MITRSVVKQAVVLQVLILVIHVWYFTAGYWTHLPDLFSWNLYDRLASAFRNGHLHLEVAPAPDLLALSDPYSIQARKGVSSYIGDATLYGGQYYLYWGPVPAVLLAIVKAAGIVGPITDAGLVLVFVCGLSVLIATFATLLWSCHFSDLPPWTLLATLPVLGLAPPFAWMLNNPLVYEAALASAEFFFIAGLLAGYIAIRRLAPGTFCFVLAGGAWALAIGCQFTQLMAVGAAVVLMALWIFRVPGSWGARQRCAAILAAALPPALMLLALGWYNHARFGSVWEFGYRYQLAVVNLHEHYRDIFQPIFALPNAYNYLLNRFLTSTSFPFIHPRYGSLLEGLRVQLPSLYYSEAITGLAFSSPIVIFAAVPVILWGRQLASGSLTAFAAGALRSPLRWLLSAIAAALLPNLAVLLFFYYSAPRYLMAVMPLLLILSALGFWKSYRDLRGRPRWRRGMLAAAALLSAWTIIVSMLLAVSSSQDRFMQGNPELILSINRLLSGT